MIALKNINSERTKMVAILLFIVVLLLLVWQAYNPIWKNHLQVDASAYQSEAMFWNTHDTWAGMPQWYQPGALWFFVAVSYLASTPAVFDAYLTAIVFVNILLISGHFYFFMRHGHRFAPFIFLILILAFGPILLFRFELLVSLLTIFAWYFWQKKSISLAAFLFGLSVAIKVYPIIIAPLFFAEALRQKQRKDIIRLVFWSAVGLGLPTAALMLGGSTLTAIISGVQFHELKPVGLDGLWGSIVTLWQQYLHIPIRLTPGYGVYGMSSDLPLLTDNFLSKAWMPPLTLIYLSIFWLFRKKGYKNPAFMLIILFVFVLFAKVLNTHYMWWSIVFLPLVPISFLRTLEWMWIMLTITLSLILSQIVYPIYYTDFINWYNSGQLGDPTIFQLSVLRNILLVLFLGILLMGLWRRSKASTPNKSII